MSAVVEPGKNDVTARDSVMDILKKSDVINEEGKITEEENLNNEEIDEETEETEETELTDEESVETESTDTVDEEAVEIDSSTLASLLGVDESDIIVGDDGSPSFRAKVDGKDTEISFDSLLRNYRLQSHVDGKATSLKEEKSQFEEEVQQIRENYKVALEQTATLFAAEENALIEEMNSVDWAALEEKDPTRYSIAREKYRERLYNLQAQRQGVIERYNEERGKMQKEMASKRNEWMEKEAELMMAAIPEWKDSAIARTQSAELKNYALNGMGFSEKEVASLVDHRAWIGIRKAMLYDKILEEADTTTKRVVNLPKVVNRKAPQGTKRRVKAKLAAKKEAARKGGPKEQLSYVTDLISR